MSRTIDVSDLPERMVEAIESLVTTYREHAADAGNHGGKTAQARPVGWLAGRMTVPDSFFDPLPDDLLGAFEGNEPGKGE